MLVAQPRCESCKRDFPRCRRTRLAMRHRHEVGRALKRLMGAAQDVGQRHSVLDLVQSSRKILFCCPRCPEAGDDKGRETLDGVARTHCCGQNSIPDHG